MNQTSASTYETVAWIRVGALGDLLVGLAALHETHALFPKARITVVGPRLWCEILSPRLYSWVDRVAAIERKGRRARIWKNLGEAWKDTDEERDIAEIYSECQAIVNQHIDSYRYGLPAWRVRVPKRLGSAPASMAWLYTQVSPFLGKDPEIHERDAALLVVGAGEAGARRFFRTVRSNRAALPQIIATHPMIQKWRKLGLPPGKPVDLEKARQVTGCEPGSYVLVNPTSSRREKAWPAARFHELLLAAKPQMKARGLEILVLGSPTETEWLKEVAGSELRIVQPANIQDLQDVLSGSRGLLTNTSSVQFIAAMTGTPTVTLMGRAKPEIWGPLGPHDQVVRGRASKELDHDIFRQEEEAYCSIRVEDVLSQFLALPDRPRVR